MKIKNLETAEKYGFKPIFQEEKLPTKLSKWRDDFTYQESIDFDNLYLEDEKIQKQCKVVSEYSDLYYFDGYLCLEIGCSRRGQYYYILCNKESLELSVIATTPDGSGSNCYLPDVLVQMILNRDVN